MVLLPRKYMSKGYYFMHQKLTYQELEQRIRQLEKRAAVHREREEALMEACTRLQHILISSPAIIYCCKAESGYGATFISENIKAHYEQTEAELKKWVDRHTCSGCGKVFENIQQLSGHKKGCN